MSRATSVPGDVAAPADTPSGRSRGKIRSYIALTKPRIIELLLVTTIPTMVLAADGWPTWTLLLSTLVGGSFAAGSANAFNSYIDRDIDAVMNRTKRRPLVTGEVSDKGALVFAWTLGVVATAWFWFVVGSAMATVLAVLAILGYVVGYSLILKRRTPQNIVWGGIAGCMPVLIGWSAVTDSLGWAPLLLFAVVFFWTPPHYWPLSMKFSRDYARAEVPMLPVVAPTSTVAVQMIAYAVAMVVVSLALVPVAGMTWVYLVAAGVAGAWFVGGCVRLYVRSERGEKPLREMALFRDSITYLTIVFAAVLVDPFISDSLTVWHP